MLSRAFLVCIICSFVGAIIIQVGMRNSSGSALHTFLNLSTLMLIPNGLAVIFGIVLFVRWISQRAAPERSHTDAVAKEEAKQEFPAKKPGADTRWSALVRFDDEIRGAAEVLRPFGEKWVVEMGRSFVVLNEDRKYLPSIVGRLLEEIVEEKEREDAEKRRQSVKGAGRKWSEAYRRTYENEAFTEESIRIIESAQSCGYIVEVQEDHTIAMSKDFGTTYLRSNADIRRFADMLLSFKQNLQ